jgi:hypothetical protein
MAGPMVLTDASGVQVYSKSKKMTVLDATSCSQTAVMPCIGLFFIQHLFNMIARKLSCWLTPLADCIQQACW